MYVSGKTGSKGLTLAKVNQLYTKMQSGIKTLYYKTINQVSIQQVQRWQKKVQKL
jgi:hypothetical protein